MNSMYIISDMKEKVYSSEKLISQQMVLKITYTWIATGSKAQILIWWVGKSKII